MGKKKSIFRAITRVAVLLPSVFYALLGYAQSSLSERLNYVLVSQDMDMGITLYNEIKNTDLEQLSDSALFDYHYLGGYLNSEIHNHEIAIYHLEEAKRLCDSSLGVHSLGYMTIMCFLGQEYIELDQFEDALAIFEEGIIKSMYMRNAEPQGFGNLIMGVQDCYEFLGWFNEIPNHLSDAWSFWDKDDSPLVAFSYYPLWRLEQFYKRYGMYEKALIINHQIQTYIKSKGGENHPKLAEALYNKGYILVKMNQPKDGIEAYKDGLTILRNNGMIDSELYGWVAGNLMITLISLEEYTESDEVLKDLEQNSTAVQNQEKYKSVLFSAAKTAADMGNYTKAIEYNTILLTLNISEEERETYENQKALILYNHEIVNSLPTLKNNFETLRIGHNDWFKTGHKLSCAHYLDNDVDKSETVLLKMYETIDLNKSIGTDYYLLVINNLFRLMIENKEYHNALRYARERFDYLTAKNIFPDEHYYDALNDLVVAKMKTNTLEDIDSNLEMLEKFYRVHYGDNSREYATYLHNRGRAYQLQNKLNKAKETFLQSIILQNIIDGMPFLEGTVKYYFAVEQELREL